MKYKDFDEYIIEQLKDEEFAREYLNASLEEYLTDFNGEAFALALKKIIVANGSVTEFAKKSNISRQHLYKLFSLHSKPQFETISQILKCLGYKIELKKCQEAS